MRYKLKEEYKEVSIAPSGKTIVLQYLNQAQIKLVIKAGFSNYFEEVENNTKKVSKKDKK